MAMILIALGHRARSGKDTIANHFVKHFGFKRYGLADLLKQSVNLVTGWDDDHAYGPLKEEDCPVWHMKPRTAYQLIGTEGYRKYMGEDVWAKALRLHMERDAAKTGSPSTFRAVISDVRFQKGEVEMVKSLGGKLWRVDRPGLPDLVVPPKTSIGKAMDRLTGRAKTWSHQSEYDLADFSGWDAIIKNDSTLEALYERAETELRKVMNEIDGISGQV